MPRLLSVWLLLLPALWGQSRVVVIGVDGMDHALTKRFMLEGILPNLRRLAERGAFEPLRPTNPAQSPTSWASITTGLNPGGTGIFGFLKRDLREGRVIPELALAEKTSEEALPLTMRILAVLGAIAVAGIPLMIARRLRRAMVLFCMGLALLLLAGLAWFFAQVPESLPGARNLRTGDAVWRMLDDAGIRTLVLDAPCAFPAAGLSHGRLLCGLGVPDMLGSMGTVTVFRDGPVPGGVRITPMGGREVALTRGAAPGVLEGAFIEGPVSPLNGRPLRIPVTFLKNADGSVNVRFQDVDERLEEGRFSRFLQVRLRFSALMETSGLVRYRLLAGGDRPVIYQEPLQFDPRHQSPFAPLTAPVAFGARLAEQGLFETAGWPTATNPYTDELIDDATIIDDVEGLFETRARRLGYWLVRGEWRFFFALLPTLDRVQHVFFSDIDEEHPAHDPQAIARHGDQIRKAYVRIDDLIGRVLRRIEGGETHLIVLSDHGFAPFRHAVNLNRWLAENGYLVGRADGPRALATGLSRPVFEHLDWSRTRAYSLGLGRIWLNLKGREPAGVVAPGAEARTLMEEIRKGLLGLRHEGRPVVRSVRAAREIYSGARLEEASDLVVGFERGYRVSWDSCLGGLDEPLIAPNRSRWSGDHCSVDPEVVPGVIFTTFPLKGDQLSVLDVVPTILDLLGLEEDAGLAGRSLVEEGR